MAEKEGGPSGKKKKLFHENGTVSYACPITRYVWGPLLGGSSHPSLGVALTSWLVAVAKLSLREWLPVALRPHLGSSLPRGPALCAGPRPSLRAHRGPELPLAGSAARGLALALYASLFLSVKWGYEYIAHEIVVRLGEQVHVRFWAQWQVDIHMLGSPPLCASVSLSVEGRSGLDFLSGNDMIVGCVCARP